MTGPPGQAPSQRDDDYFGFSAGAPGTPSGAGAPGTRPGAGAPSGPGALPPAGHSAQTPPFRGYPAPPQPSQGYDGDRGYHRQATPPAYGYPGYGGVPGPPGYPGYGGAPGPPGYPGYGQPPAPPRRRTTGVALLASLAVFVIAAAVAVPLIVLKVGGSFTLPEHTSGLTRMAGTTTTSSLSGLQSSMSRDAHVEVAAYGTTASGPMVLSVVAADTPEPAPSLDDMTDVLSHVFGGSNVQASEPQDYRSRGRTLRCASVTVPSKLISWCVWADEHTVGGPFALNNDPADLANLTAPLVATIEN